MKTYRDAGDAYRNGQITYSQLLKAMLLLPPPQPKKRARTAADIYAFADEPPLPNSFTWISRLMYSGHLTPEQVSELKKAALKESV